MKKILVGVLALFTSTVLTNPAVFADVSSKSGIDTNTDTDTDTVTSVSPTSITHNPDGSTTYVFDVNGYQNIITTPPKNFDPLTASDDDLMKFGYPPRPTNQVELDAWKAFVTKRIITTPDHLSVHSHHRNLCSAQPYYTTPDSGYDESTCNWSGTEATANYNEWDQVSAHFKAPRYAGTSPSGARVSSWVGLGGDLVFSSSNDGLIQCGFELSGPTSNPVPWYEWVSSNSGVSEVAMPGLTVHQGDNVQAYVEYDPNTAGGKATFGLVDFTTNTSNAVVVTNLSSFYSGMTAEFIDERPTVNCQYAPLLNYGSDTWTTCEVHSIWGYWNPVGALSHIKIEMKDPSNLAMSAPSSLNSTKDGFTEYWHRST